MMNNLLQIRINETFQVPFCPIFSVPVLLLAQAHNMCYKIFRLLQTAEDTPIIYSNLRQCEQLLFTKSLDIIRDRSPVQCESNTDDWLARIPSSPYLARVLTQINTPNSIVNDNILKMQFLSDLGYHSDSASSSIASFCSFMKQMAPDVPALDILEIPRPLDMEDGSAHTYSSSSSDRLLCVVYTMEKNHDAVIAIANSWGSKCDGFIAFSTKEDMTVPTVSIPHAGAESYDNMWQKVVSIVTYIHSHHSNEFDWVFLCGDDTYMIPENLKLFLAEDSDVQLARTEGRGVYVGQQFYLDEGSIHDLDEKLRNHSKRMTYNSGGAGYVLDTAVSLAVVAESLLNEPDFCRSGVETSAEDVYMANCLRKFGIHPFESRDASERERFHHFSPDMAWHYSPSQGVARDWWASHMMEFRNGSACCAPSSVSFHHMKANHIKAVDAYIHLCKRQEVEVIVDEEEVGFKRRSGSPMSEE